MNSAPQLQWSRHRRLPLRLVAAILICLAACGGLLSWKRTLQSELETRERALEWVLARSSRTPSAQPPATPSPAAMRQFREQAALLNRDWAGLSNLLVPRGKNVRLLGMDVNPASGAIRISGNADSAIAANAYAASLEKSASELAQVRLLSVERKADGVRFEVAAQWTD
jgi:hypothetical protein